MRTLIRRLHREDAGMTTAEYAVGTVAAVAFAAVLYKVVTSAAVLQALSSIVTSALQVHL
jgi:Flp pilus assembly pilin Flp